MLDYKSCIDNLIKKTNQYREYFLVNNKYLSQSPLRYNDFIMLFHNLVRYVDKCLGMHDEDVDIANLKHNVRTLIMPIAGMVQQNKSIIKPVKNRVMSIFSSNHNWSGLEDNVINRLFDDLITLFNSLL